MDKRMVWSAAGAITITVVAASSAIAVSMNGTPDRSSGDPGTFSPSAVTASTVGAASENSVQPQVITVYVDETTTTSVAPTASMIGSTVPAPPIAVASATAPTNPAPAVTTSGASGTGSSSGIEDDHDDHGDERGSGHEYEGGDDDD